MATFTEQNEALYQASYRAQFISGTIQPVMMFASNLNYVLVAVVGGLLIAGGSLTLGAVTAFIQYSRQFSQPLTQVASMANLLQSSVASAERVFALLDAPEQTPDAEEPARPAGVQGRVEFEDVSFRYVPDRPLIEHVSLIGRAGGDGGDRRADRGRQDDPGQPADAVLRDRLGPDPARWRRHRADEPRGAARADRHGAAGRVAVRRHHRGEHRLRPAGRHARADRRGGQGHLRGPVRADAARRLRRPCWTTTARTSAWGSGS